MRVVIDTNILMAGLICPEKASGKILEMWRDGDIDVVVSSGIEGEYHDILSKMRFGSREAVQRREESADRLLELCTVVEPKRHVNVVLDDPADNKFIDCALAGRADYIITQDHHLLDIGQVEDTKIVTSRRFLDVLGTTRNS
ncbi:putative toxin-antitoxin system toxin component, PIN family [Desulforudis sp. 1088]|uniref:putative toxin-antitoxin system toxin component, PIN family n=1 Tax=unclassified Candidatus Desulforudis TaxID=2635950 RepID=UPI0034998D5A